jgi:hypothetical protein
MLKNKINNIKWLLVILVLAMGSTDVLAAPEYNSENIEALNQTYFFRDNTKDLSKDDHFDGKTNVLNEDYTKDIEQTKHESVEQKLTNFDQEDPSIFESSSTKQTTNPVDSVTDINIPDLTNDVSAIDLDNENAEVPEDETEFTAESPTGDPTGLSSGTAPSHINLKHDVIVGIFYQSMDGSRINVDGNFKVELKNDLGFTTIYGVCGASDYIQIQTNGTRETKLQESQSDTGFIQCEFMNTGKIVSFDKITKAAVSVTGNFTAKILAVDVSIRKTLDLDSTTATCLDTDITSSTPGCDSKNDYFEIDL